MTRSIFPARALAVALLCLIAGSVHAQDPKTIRIGFVTFLSGPAAGPFGVPAKQAAEAIVESLNAGKGPAPYNTKGLGGMPIELVVIDEAGGTTKQVTEYRNLVERRTSISSSGTSRAATVWRSRPSPRSSRSSPCCSIAARRASSRKRATSTSFARARTRPWTPSPPRCICSRPGRPSRTTPASTRTTPGARTPGPTSMPR